jgi:hypothetical protein
VKVYPNFENAIVSIGKALLDISYPVSNKSWQSRNIEDKPEMRTRELFDVCFRVPLSHNLEQLAEDTGANWPWAEDHFQERVGGVPLNPGVQWANWPWALSADTFRKGDQFSHTYMERYWPKYAGHTSDKDFEGYQEHIVPAERQGVRYSYGDLDDVIRLLERDPMTRQAYLPVWFPEDTGCHTGERVPCTLGYHFIRRNGFLHVIYYIRSCDYTRHFRDDLYLTARLLQWVLEFLQDADPNWSDVQTGFVSFHCTSLHIFENDFRKLEVDLRGPSAS